MTDISDKIIAVDLDNTLSEPMDDWSRYLFCVPKKENILKINQLYNNNTIIIYSARPEEDRLVTLKWLKEHRVMFHRLVLGKLKVDIYIDNDSLRMEDL